MSYPLIAKSQTNEVGKSWRTLEEHTRDLLAAYQQIIEAEGSKSSFPANEKRMIFMCCVLHDLGKSNSKFQSKLYAAIPELENKKIRMAQPNKNELRHELLSPTFFYKALESFDEMDEIEKQVLIKAVMLHHKSFEAYFDLGGAPIEEAVFYDVAEDMLAGNNQFDWSPLSKLLAETLPFTIEIKEENLSYDYYLDFHKEIGASVFEQYPDVSEEERTQLDFRYKQLYIEVKGFLNLLDHIASSQERQPFNYYFTKEEQEQTDRRLLKFIQQKTGDANATFNKLQEEIVQFKEQPLVITEAFTGAGKTICSERLTANKKIYLTPNRISAMSFYQEAIEKFDKKNVGVLHGTLHLYKGAKEEENTEMFLTENEIELARNFAKPYLLATVDQIAMTIFKYPGYEKVLAVLKNTRVCVDEIHLLSPRMFVAFTYLMDYAMKYLNTKFHLMTATLPEIYKEHLKDLSGYQGIQESPKLSIGEKKVRITLNKKEKEIASICQEAIQHNQQVLIILNTVDDVIKCYEKLRSKLPPKTEIQCLHSRFKERESKRLYQDIIEQKGHIWITTQVVEIALDIDFPIVISDLAPMDSLIQRMGRNNRKGMLEAGGEFFILSARESSVYDDVLLKVTETLLKKESKKQDKKQPLILDMHDRKELLGKYYQEKKTMQYFEKEFKEADKDIRKIFGLLEREKLSGETLFLDQEPYRNIADNRKEAVKYFRNADMQIKVYLEEDSEKTALSGNGISISGNRYYRLKNAQGIIEEQKRSVLKKEKYEYSSKYGLKFLEQEKTVLKPS